MTDYTDIENRLEQHAKAVRQYIVSPVKLEYITEKQKVPVSRPVFLRKLFVAVLIAVVLALSSVSTYAAVLYFNGDLYNDWIYCSPEPDTALIQSNADDIQAMGEKAPSTDPLQVVDSFLRGQEFYGTYDTTEFLIKQKSEKVVFVSSENGGLYVELSQPERHGENGIWTVRRYRLVNKKANPDAQDINRFTDMKIGEAFSLSLPDVWYVHNTGYDLCFKVSDMTVARLEIYDINQIPGNNMTWFVGNHAEIVSAEKVPGMVCECYKVVYKRTQPAAAADQTALCQTAFAFINNGYEYVLTFNSVHVDGKAMSRIAAGFQFINAD